MSAAAWLVASVLTAATPAPGPAGNLDDNPAGGGTPGLAGFLFTFALALVVIGLALSLVRGMRRMERNNRLREASSDAPGPVADQGVPQESPSQAPVPSAEPPDEVVQPPVPPAPPAG